ncbi:MAG: FkbM family methyltransferase [Bacteroidales bacterium]|nr:FkbM family methyltransferase [Bacteroidales bacterium]
MYIVAWIIKVLFHFKFIQKHYFGFYRRIFKPLNLFKGVSATCRYNGTFKMKVDLDDWIQQNVFFIGVYDPIHIRFLKKYLKEGDIFIDIGANVGCFTLVGSAAVGENGHVFAFEPIKIVADRLDHNILINRLENVTVVRKAVFNEDTNLEFYFAKQENLGMSSIHRHDTESGMTQEIPAITLDHYLMDKEVTGIKLIKIDIEGAEIYALEGMKNTISIYKPAFIVEVSAQVLGSESDRDKVFDFFDAMEYQNFVLDQNIDLIHPLENQLADCTNFVFLPK